MTSGAPDMLRNLLRDAASEPPRDTLQPTREEIAELFREED